MRIPTFEGLPDDQLDWFISQSQEIVLKAGDTFLQQGAPAVAMIVVLDGEQQMRGALGGEAVTIPLKPGDISGLLPFSRMKVSVMTGRAVTDGRILKFPSAQFPELVQKMPELAQRLVGLMSDRIRETTRHRATARPAGRPGKTFGGAGARTEQSGVGRQTRHQPAARGAASHQGIGAGVEQARSYRRPEIGNRKAGSFVPAARTKRRSIPWPSPIWKTRLIPCCAAMARTTCGNWRPTWRGGASSRKCWSPCSRALDAEVARAALVRIAASVEIANLLIEIESSTSRISDLVRAIKEYTYMDQSTAQNVDIVKGLENTLTIMNHKLKRGVTVQRQYEKVPLLVNSFGSELNQVWTNIIDNAIDAMGGKGELRVRTYRDDSCVVVEIGDNGPGISPEIKAHIFEPFFTTKGVGEGTGLGLDTVMRIVKKHRGTIQVTSKPGDTRFQVFLPLVRSSSLAALTAHAMDRTRAGRVRAPTAAASRR